MSERIVEASFWAAAAPGGGDLPAPAIAEVAFAGRSNVGKSSLINQLVDRRNLVRVGATPGTTRQINLFRVRLADGLELGLVDLPGYGYAARSHLEQKQWQKLIERYLSERVTLRALIVLLDIRRGIEREELELVEFLRARPHPSGRTPALIWVATKFDKLSPSAQKPALATLRRNATAVLPAEKGGAPVAIGFSAITGQGKDELWKAIRGAL